MILCDEPALQETTFQSLHLGFTMNSLARNVSLQNSMSPVHRKFVSEFVKARSRGQAIYQCSCFDVRLDMVRFWSYVKVLTFPRS